MNQDLDRIVGFGAGAFLHLVMWYTRIQFGPLSCVDKGCGSILAWDIPVSVVYFAFDERKIILFSLVAGTVLWGFIFYGLLKLTRRLVGGG